MVTLDANPYQILSRQDETWISNQHSNTRHCQMSNTLNQQWMVDWCLHKKKCSDFFTKPHQIKQNNAKFELEINWNYFRSVSTLRHKCKLDMALWDQDSVNLDLNLIGQFSLIFLTWISCMVFYSDSFLNWFFYKIEGNFFLACN